MLRQIASARRFVRDQRLISTKEGLAGIRCPAFQRLHCSGATLDRPQPRTIGPEDHQEQFDLGEDERRGRDASRALTVRSARTSSFDSKNCRSSFFEIAPLKKGGGALGRPSMW